jgi:hypothetical protein
MHLLNTKRIINMKLRLIIPAVCTLLFSHTTYSQKSENPVADTKWVHVIGEDFTDYIVFEDSTRYCHYTFEDSDTVFGRYRVFNDTVELISEYSVFDKDFPFNSRHRLQPSKYIAVLKKSRLIFIERYELNSASRFEFDSLYHFSQTSK